MKTKRLLALGAASVIGLGWGAFAAAGEAADGRLPPSASVEQALGLGTAQTASSPMQRPLMLSALPAEPAPSDGTTVIEVAPAERDLAPAEPDAAAMQPPAPPLALNRPVISSFGETYRGGRGLITLQGMSGMFLNPTSGTLNQGQLTAQYCVFFNDYDTSVIGHGLMLDYGITDWLNVGVFGTAADVPGKDLFSNPIAVGGPFARVRILKDEGWVPELAIGGIWLDGGPDGDLLARKEGFIAGSKLFPVADEGYLRSVRFHGGFRYLSRTEAPTPADESYVYAGLEIELPYSFYLIGELSSANLNQRGDDDLPYAVGVQWKPTSVIGISVAHMNPAGTQPALKEGFWFGIGLNFQL